MIRTEYLLLVIGMGFVTYIPRWFPILFLAGRELPQWFTEWLDLIPVAILSALVFPSLVTSGDPLHLDLFKPQLLVAIPTFLFALKTKSMGGTVVVGMLLFWLIGKLI
jgi:branched-subunit amino acid transport protein